MAPFAMVVASTLGWPALQLLVFWLRFQRMPPEGMSAAFVFIPMGLVAGAVAAILMSRASTDRQRRATVWGYLAATPFAFLGALLGGLVLSGVWGPLVAGGIPLIIGAGIGFVVGRPASGDVPD